MCVKRIVFSQQGTHRGVCGWLLRLMSPERLQCTCDRQRHTDSVRVRDRDTLTVYAREKETHWYDMSHVHRSVSQATSITAIMHTLLFVPCATHIILCLSETEKHSMYNNPWDTLIYVRDRDTPIRMKYREMLIPGHFKFNYFLGVFKINFRRWAEGCHRLKKRFCTRCVLARHPKKTPYFLLKVQPRFVVHLRLEGHLSFKQTPVVKMTAAPSARGPM